LQKLGRDFRSKGATPKFDIEKFSLKKLTKVDVEKGISLRSQAGLQLRRT
jgi:hypothetical protein